MKNVRGRKCIAIKFWKIITTWNWQRVEFENLIIKSNTNVWHVSFSFFIDINPSPIPIFSTAKYNISRNPQIPDNTGDFSENSLLVKSRNLTMLRINRENRKPRKRGEKLHVDRTISPAAIMPRFVFRAVNNNRSRVRGSQDKATRGQHCIDWNYPPPVPRKVMHRSEPAFKSCDPHGYFPRNRLAYRCLRLRIYRRASWKAPRVFRQVSPARLVPRQEHIDPSVGTASTEGFEGRDRFRCSTCIGHWGGCLGSGLKPLVNKFVVYPIEDFHGPCRVNNPLAV